MGKCSVEGTSNPLFVAQENEKRGIVEINSSDYHKWKWNTLKISLLSLLASVEETGISFCALREQLWFPQITTKGFKEKKKKKPCKNNSGKTQSWELPHEVPNSKGIPAHYQRLFPENPWAKHALIGVKHNNDKKIKLFIFPWLHGDVGYKRQRHSRL